MTDEVDDVQMMVEGRSMLDQHNRDLGRLLLIQAACTLLLAAIPLVIVTVGTINWWSEKLQ